MRLFFFSGTGNSLAIAKAIAARCDAQLTNIAQAVKNNDYLYEDKEIGIIFPLYCHGAPRMVVEFMKKLRSPFVDYMFVVCDGAGSMPGMFRDEALRYLAGNIKTVSSYYIRSVTNYLPFGDIPPAEKVQDILSAMDVAIGKVLQSIQNREIAEPKSGIIMSGINKTVARAIKHGFEQNIHKTSKKFSVDEKCVSCGLCTRVCPAENVVLVEGQPKWLDKCECCLACLHWCPKSAIQMGNSAKKRRYHNPNVSAEELFLK